MALTREEEAAVSADAFPEEVIRTLVCPTRRHADVANPSCLHDIVQRLHLCHSILARALNKLLSAYSLLNWCVPVEAVAL